MERMNCWRTTWASRLTNIGASLMTFAMMSGTGLTSAMGVSTEALTKRDLAIICLIGWALRTLGTECHGRAGADQQEVKKQLGLAPDGVPAIEPPDPLDRTPPNLKP